MGSACSTHGGDGRNTLKNQKLEAFAKIGEQINIRVDLNEVRRDDFRLDTAGSGWRPMVGSCAHDLAYIKASEFLH
jgi:hypothetical protein